MPLTPETIAVKPYNQCINCDKRGVICDGPNVVAMSLERFCEWCRELKDYRGWSNVKLSEISGVSKATIDRLVSGRITGLNGETISAVTCSLVYGHAPDGDNWGKYPCPLAVGVPESEAEKLRLDNEMLLRQLEQQTKNDRDKIDFLKQQIAFKEDQMRIKDEQIAFKDQHLMERANFIYRKDRIIAIMAVLLGISVLVVIGALLIDLFNPNVGFFWLEHMSVVGR